MSWYHKSCVIAGVLVLFYSVDFAVPEKSAASVATDRNNQVSEGESTVLKSTGASESSQLLHDSAGSETDDACTDARQPGVSVVILKSLIVQWTQRTIDQQLPLEDFILGTKITGTSHLIGRPEIHLLPDSKGWKFEFVLNGTVESQSVGTQSYVRIHSRSTTQFQARKSVRISPEGIQDQPCVSTARTHSVTTSIVPRSTGMQGRIVKSVATRRVAESRSAADQIASRHAEARINAQIDERFQRASNLLQAVLSAGPFATTLSNGIPLHASMHTTTDYLWLELSQASVDPTPAPAAELAGRSGFQVQLHGSLLASLLHAAGQVLPTRLASPASLVQLER